MHSEEGRLGRRTIESPDGAPPPIGPYSPGVEAGGWLFLSGQIALTTDGTIIPGGTGAEARLIFGRLSRMLQQAGYQMEDIVKLTLYLTDLSAFQTVNEVCEANFKVPYPARVTIQVSGLPKGATLEVDVIAWKGDRQ